MVGWGIILRRLGEIIRAWGIIIRRLEDGGVLLEELGKY